MGQHSEELHVESWLAIESQANLFRSLAELLQGVSTVDRTLRKDECKEEGSFAPRGMDGVARAVRGGNGEERRGGS